MTQRILDDGPLLLAQMLRSFNLDETTSAARFIESLTFDEIFREEWESIFGNQQQLQFYNRISADISDAMKNHNDLENSVQEKAGQLLDEVRAHYEQLCKYLAGNG
ncbi:hypothetical protein CAter282_2315 [Collimonas arenae]|uniref:Uncharacterized protein n=2 Tax=Collimonas arenae TaxID=279058 RepID=A0A127PS39_9BURK|nr:hypothetical protein CAter10_2546 [Collimonas arenae]AMP10065.1 hypothetical protein CAter282_2315 [Collimonas arenae]